MCGYVTVGTTAGGAQPCRDVSRQTDPGKQSVTEGQSLLPPSLMAKFKEQNDTQQFHMGLTPRLSIGHGEIFK